MQADDVLFALGRVQDPLTGGLIQPEHRVRDLLIKGNAVQFKLLLPGLAPEMRPALIQACELAVTERMPGAEVHVHLVADGKPSSSIDALPQVANIVAVASGKGGVGKSTVSANLAVALAADGHRVGLVDADLYGPSVPTLFGTVGQRPAMTEVYGTPKLLPLQAHGVHHISIGSIIEPEQAVVLRGPRLAGIVRQFLLEVVWPALDVLIVDLPPGTGDIQLTLVQTVPVDGALLVTTPQQLAYADALKALNMFRLPNVNVPILGVVENLSYFTPDDAPGKRYRLFGEGAGKRLAKEAESLLLAELPLVPEVGRQSDGGRPIASDPNAPATRSFQQLADGLLAQLALRHQALPPTRAVQVQ